MPSHPELCQPTPENIERVAKILNDGGRVGLPTETVYGLAADATQDKAVAKIFAAKQRPEFNPLIVHVPDRKSAEALVTFNEAATVLADQFWPGPLALILPQKPDNGISKLVSAGLDTLAVRVPAHPAAQAVLKALGKPVAAPSANRSGTISPTTPEHVLQSLGDAVDLILAGGRCRVGLESTVIDLSGDVPVMLRPGAITVEDVSDFIESVTTSFTAENDKPKSPGQLLRHYAPNTPLRLNAVDLHPDEALLGFGSLKFMGVVGAGHIKDLPDTQYCNLSESGDPTEAASNLFAMLHMLDQRDFKPIAVMSIPQVGLGIAINDRLAKAAAAHP